MSINTKPAENDVELSVKDKSHSPLHIAFLDGIRGLAALHVMIFHFLGLDVRGLPPLLKMVTFPFQFGHFAVDVFMILSGFSLMLPVANAKDSRLRGGMGQYIKRRAMRILPPYYAAFVISLIATALLPDVMHSRMDLPSKIWTDNWTIGNILSHLLVIHNLRDRWAFTTNMAFWSVATEWQIYFLFPLLLLPVWRRFGIYGAVVVGFLVGMLPQFILPDKYTLNQACPWYIGLFAMGMMGAVLLVRFKDVMLTHVRKLPVYAFICLVLYVMAKFVLSRNIGHGFANHEWIKDALIGTAAVLIIVYLGLYIDRQAQAARPFLLRILESKWAVTLGAFSYSIYLTHCIVLQQAEVAIYYLHLSPVGAFVFNALVGIPIAILFAYLFHLAFERPFMAKRAKKNPPPVVVPRGGEIKTETGYGLG